MQQGFSPSSRFEKGLASAAQESAVLPRTPRCVLGVPVRAIMAITIRMLIE
ncbi:hypothetical protein SAMN05421509_10143 [Chromohalobacter canadensis]|uniref:Uncharacterized protein n=1 Tax=Chromohalobacter canadensis TaxID=141389 RepID=A0A285VA54_9GAMM|nr:hypothetical protein SAMN05421509_10143 [Chromohalobacter canadensis]